MTAELDQVYEALVVLWKKQGATVHDISKQPALMKLSYLVAKAAHRKGMSSPPPLAIAQEVRLSILDATTHLTSPTQENPERPDDAEAARILLGLVPGMRGSSRRIRRTGIMRLLNKSETQIAHMRGGSTYELRSLYLIAEILCENEAYYTRDFTIANISTEIRDFECVTFEAHLRLHDRLTLQNCISRIVTLKALRDGAEWFHFHEVFPSQSGIPDETRVIESGDYVAADYSREMRKAAHPTHRFKLRQPCEKDATVTLAFDTNYLVRAEELLTCMNFCADGFGNVPELVTLAIELPQQYPYNVTAEVFDVVGDKDYNAPIQTESPYTVTVKLERLAPRSICIFNAFRVAKKAE